MKLFEVLKRTPHIEHDTDENGYAVYDSNGKLIEKFWYSASEKKIAHKAALTLLGELRKKAQ